MLSPAGRRHVCGKSCSRSFFRCLVILLWQWAGNGGSLFGGVLPTPDRVWQAWKVWAFGTTSGLEPQSL